MDIETIGATLEFIGTIMIAYTALRVHHRFWKERGLDEKVFRAMKREQIIGVTGVVLVSVGFVIQLVVKS